MAKKNETSASPTAPEATVGSVYYVHDLGLVIGEPIMYSAPAEVKQLIITNIGVGDAEVRYLPDSEGKVTKENIMLATGEEATIDNEQVYFFSYSCPVLRVQQLT